ncbi:retinol dehydrogenase 12 [Setomelanomma holmii]|uniref:Retinol dehydrogenase 12 n=1 Tax=Setomelanomma holmii TaxID=210430 RepID=A0A9P4LSI2_9PLEO|nr:retinol dehydrogenase 12 [Setomelanomma holmii]
MSTFNSKTSALDVAQKHSSRITDKTVLITGVTLGSIGEATARAFAHGGAATIIITGRDRTKLANALSTLAEAYPKTTFRPLMLNLSSTKAVQDAANEILKDEAIPQLDFVIANAGINGFDAPRTETADGIELHFGVNHLAHYLLVKLLLPKIKAAAAKNPPGMTRIIIVSSGQCFASPIRFSDWNFEKALNDVPDAEKPKWAPLASALGLPQEAGVFQANIAYSQSKTANILTAVQLNKLLATEGIYSFALSPGLVNSNAGKRVMPKMKEESLKKLGEPKTLEQGAATTLVAATDPDLKPDDGVYFADCQPAMKKCPPFASDPVAAEKLWLLSDEILGSRG